MAAFDPDYRTPDDAKPLRYSEGRDNVYPRGPGRYPLYPSPVGIYTPVGSPVTPMGAANENDNAVFPPAQAKTMGTLQDKSASVGPWNKMVEGYQSPGQSDQDIINKPAPVYSASVDQNKPKPPQAVWTNPDGTTSGYYQQGGKSGGSVMSIPKEAMMNISPETSRALAGARAAAADRGDFEAISNSYGGDFAGGKYAGGGGGGAPQAPDVYGDLISSAKSRLATVMNDTSYTGRVTRSNILSNLSELGKLQEAQQRLGIEGGDLQVKQRDAATRERNIPIAQAHADAAKSLANTQYMATLPKAQRELLENAVLGGDNPQAQSGYRKGKNAIEGRPDAIHGATNFQFTTVPIDEMNRGVTIGGFPGSPTSPVNSNQYGPAPQSPLR